MTLDFFRTYCLGFKGVTEETPFDNVTLVFKVVGKMFALADMDIFESITLKCDPDKAIELREQYDSVNEGYHMHKKYWNTITINSDMADKKILTWIKHSYDLIVASLPKKVREELANL